MKKYILLIATATTALTACNKSYLDLNENPNNPSVVPAASLVAAAEVRTANLMVDGNLATVNVWMDQWAYSPNYAVNQDSRDYKFTTTFAAGAWTNLYAVAYDYQKIIDFAVAQNNPALEGIGRTMKSMLVGYLVDLYNNIPYTDAFKGALNKAPKYDNGKDVYEAIYNDLTLALTKLKTPNATFPTATQDIMFEGNKDLWVKLANTIKLRLLLRQSGRADRAAYIAGKVASDFPGGLSNFLQADESALINPGYANADLKQTPYWAGFGYNAAGTKTGNNDFFKAASYAVTFYTSQQDWRIGYMQKPVANGAGPGTMFGLLFRGNEMGSQGQGSLTYSDNMDNLDLTGTGAYRQPTLDQPVLTDFESLFLQAEAVQKGWFTGNAQTIFESAMLQSFVYMFDRTEGPGNGAIYYSTYMVPDARNNWVLATNKTQLILTQKWASLNTINFFEPWAEYRRTVGLAGPDRGYPDVPFSSSLSRGPHIPFRLKYPQSEYDLNGANVGAQGNIDQFTSKIWWMP
ncbi:MAG TPA: SusD/RagB family nutrient-binding outer membrane lipoprotein [Chitinophagaceae bacterium]|nr:SusD/RagB family nutrient-binding outer membrane lipoprotein [Chitinophagaceae bacterium]